MKRGRRQSGFALLMTLVLVVIAGATLAGLARRSLAGAVEAQASVHELQRRWAVTSLRAALLGRIESQLDNAERGIVGKDQTEGGGATDIYRNNPMPRLRLRCELAGIQYELMLTDEQAKLNLNTSLANQGIAQTQAAVKRLTNDVDHDAAAVLLRPRRLVHGATLGAPVTQTIDGYGQVFSKPTPATLIGDEHTIGRVETVTCWGGGKINIRRAPASVLRQACEKALGRDTCAALIAARDRRPFDSLPALLDRLDRAGDRERLKAMELLTDFSACHGLWIVAHGATRSWHTLAIGVTQNGGPDAAGGGANLVERYEFAW